MLTCPYETLGHWSDGGIERINGVPTCLQSTIKNKEGPLSITESKSGLAHSEGIVQKKTNFMAQQLSPRAEIQFAILGSTRNGSPETTVWNWVKTERNPIWKRFEYLYCQTHYNVDEHIGLRGERRLVKLHTELNSIFVIFFYAKFSCVWFLFAFVDHHQRQSNRHNNEGISIIMIVPNTAWSQHCRRDWMPCGFRK